jgi:hypothetical protein
MVRSLQVTWRQVFYTQCALAAISLLFGFSEVVIVRSLKLVHPSLVVLHAVVHTALVLSAFAAPIALAVALSRSPVRVMGRWFLMTASLFLSGYQVFVLARAVM